MRTKRAILNALISLVYQFTLIICGFILPRFIISTFGSGYNGVVSSINQFLSCTVLLRAGLGGVTRYALYKPLYNNDKKQISAIVNATCIFMKKIAWLYLVFLIIFATIFPIVVAEEYNYTFSFTLALIIGISTFAENYFGITYQILLQADQNYYLISMLSIITTIFNTIFSVVLIINGFSIHVVKLVSALVYCINPICLYVIVRKKYDIDKNVVPDFCAIKKRWDAFAQQVAVFVINNTDVMILSIFTDIQTVSVYSVYYLVAFGIKKIQFAITESIEAALGNIVVENDKQLLKLKFEMVEYFTLCTSFVLFSTAAFLITNFVCIYTMGVTDAIYERPIFGIVICLDMYLYCSRQPYDMLISASGAFKMVKKYSITEAIINIVLSCVLVYKLGLLGVSIGTLMSVLYGEICVINYSATRILKCKICDIVKKHICFLLGLIIMIFMVRTVCIGDVNTFRLWIIKTIKVLTVSCVCAGIVSCLFFRRQMKDVISHIRFIVIRRSINDKKNN